MTSAETAMFQATRPQAGADNSRHLDIAGNQRIGIMMEMVGALSRAGDPREVLRAYGEGMQKLEGARGFLSLSTRGLGFGEYRITRKVLDEGSRHLMYSADPWSRAGSIPVQQGGLIGQIVKSAYPALIQHLHVPHDPVLGTGLAPYRCLMAVPLFDNGEPLNWGVLLHRDPEGFTIEDLEHEILRGNMVGTMVKSALMSKQLRSANQRIQVEIEQIAKIQRALLPQSLPQIPGLSIATSYETFDTAGGDLYDFTVLDAPASGPTRFDGWLAMLVADAAGHGPAAAVLTAMLNALLYAYPRQGRGPGHVLEFANKHLVSKQIEGTFVTAFLAVFNPKDYTLMYARAGHNPPLIKNPGSGGAVARLEDVGGIPLGILEDANFDDGITKLLPGQTFVMYTDGITEAANPAGEAFGVAGIERALEACSGEPVCVVESITAALREHEAGVRPRDDQTIVAMKVEPVTAQVTISSSKS